ncbi:MAG: hypothetical protein R2748_19615 [Bryobacterales bacterium]
MLVAQVKSALTETLKHPSIAVFNLPAIGFTSMPMALVSIAISVGVVNGIVGRARRHGLHPIHVAALFYPPILLLWNFLLMERFWLPFLPLFLTGASFELQRMPRWRAPVGERARLETVWWLPASGSARCACRLWALPRFLEQAPDAGALLAARHALMEPLKSPVVAHPPGTRRTQSSAMTTAHFTSTPIAAYARLLAPVRFVLRTGRVCWSVTDRLTDTAAALEAPLGDRSRRLRDDPMRLSRSVSACTKNRRGAGRVRVGRWARTRPRLSGDALEQRRAAVGRYAQRP